MTESARRARIQCIKRPKRVTTINLVSTQNDYFAAENQHKPRRCGSVTPQSKQDKHQVPPLNNCSVLISRQAKKTNLARPLSCVLARSATLPPRAIFVFLFFLCLTRHSRNATRQTVRYVARSCAQIEGLEPSPLVGLSKMCNLSNLSFGAWTYDVIHPTYVKSSTSNRIFVALGVF